MWQHSTPVMTLWVAGATGVLVALAALALTAVVRRFSTTSWHVPAAAVLGALAPALARSWLELLGLALMAISFGSLLAVDAAVHRLPRVLLWPAVAALPVFVGAASNGDLAAVMRTATWTAAPLGTAAAGSAVFLAFFGLLGVASGGGLGFGDVVLAPFIGFVAGFYGWGAVVGTLLATFIFSGLYAAILLAGHRATRATHVAFGPWMVVGVVVGLAVGGWGA